MAKIATFSSEPETRRYLESLVARAYAEIHESREARGRVHVRRWFAQELPQTFRRHVRAFWLAVAVTLAGCAFGVLALRIDPEAKAVIMPFGGLMESPATRVAREEHAKQDRLHGVKTTFAAELMTHNTRVALFTLGARNDLGLRHHPRSFLQRRHPRRRVVGLYSSRPVELPDGLAPAARRRGNSRHPSGRTGRIHPGRRAHRLGHQPPRGQRCAPFRRMC